MTQLGSPGNVKKHLSPNLGKPSKHDGRSVGRFVTTVCFNSSPHQEVAEIQRGPTWLLRYLSTPTHRPIEIQRGPDAWSSATSPAEWSCRPQNWTNRWPSSVTAPKKDMSTHRKTNVRGSNRNPFIRSALESVLHLASMVCT